MDAVNTLESALRNARVGAIGLHQFWKAGPAVEKLEAGDGDRTRDVQLGKLAFYR